MYKYFLITLQLLVNYYIQMKGINFFKLMIRIEMIEIIRFFLQRLI